MPQAASIPIADSVPVTRNYPPVGTANGISNHADVSTAGTPAGQSTFVLKLKPATNSTARRVDIVFALPVEYTDTSTSEVLVKDTFRFTGQWIIPPTSTALLRANFEALVRNLISHATVKGYIKDGDPEY